MFVPFLLLLAFLFTPLAGNAVANTALKHKTTPVVRNCATQKQFDLRVDAIYIGLRKVRNSERLELGRMERCVPKKIRMAEKTRAARDRAAWLARQAKQCQGSERYLLCYYEQRGHMSRAGASGVIGNQTQESGLNPHADAGGQIGISQWTGGRAAELVTFDARAHLNPYSLEGQAAYTLYELRTGYSSLLNYLTTASSPTAAAYEFEVVYERAGAPAMANREGYAEAAYQLK
jgi:hypothetical protein